MGKGTKQTTTTAADPTTLARERQMWNSANQLAQNQFQAYDPSSRVAGMNSMMRQGATAVQGAVGSGNAAMQAGVEAALGAAGYTPQMLQAQQSGLAQAGLSQTGPASSADVSNLMGLGGEVEASSIGAMDAAAKMGQYQNPYEEQVVQSTLGDIDRARQMAITQGQARATAAGAYGGSRHGIADAETNRAALERAIAATGQLRSQGFTTAAGLGAQDASRALQAEQANQQAALAAGTANLNAGLSRFGTMANLGMFNAGQANQLGMFNVGQANQLGLSNAQMANQLGMFNAQQMNQMAMQNQQAGLTANQQRLGAGTALGQLGMGTQQMGLAGADALYRGGQIEQGIEQATRNAQYEEFQRRQAFPYQQLAFLQGFKGTPGQVQTTQTPGSGLGGILGAVGTIAGGPLGGLIGQGLGGLFGGGAAGAANAATQMTPNVVSSGGAMAPAALRGFNFNLPSLGS